MNPEEEILSIHERNRRVEADKAWETSPVRITLVAGITYVVVGLTFLAISVTRPWLTAFVPTFGFIVSTLTIGPVKKWWIKKRQ